MVEAPGPEAPRIRYHKWFVTSPGGAWAINGDEAAIVPQSVAAHAKTMGTRMTACGIACDSWPKYWEVKFPPRQAPACPECLVHAGL